LLFPTLFDPSEARCRKAIPVLISEHAPYRLKEGGPETEWYKIRQDHAKGLIDKLKEVCPQYDGG